MDDLLMTGVAPLTIGLTRTESVALLGAVLLAFWLWLSRAGRPARVRAWPWRVLGFAWLAGFPLVGLLLAAPRLPGPHGDAPLIPTSQSLYVADPGSQYGYVHRYELHPAGDLMVLYLLPGAAVLLLVALLSVTALRITTRRSRLRPRSVERVSPAA